jgi:arylsulfatase A-like enzyme
LIVAAGVWLVAGMPGRAAATAAPKPNFVFILIDDLGWTDAGCYGSTFYETPNIDRLAKQGMRFSDGYAACCVCSPTRASILAGKYPARLHLTDWIAGSQRPFAKLAIPDWTMYLKHEEVTLAEALKPAGYATAAMGKWHLGGEEFRPETQGFDLNFGGDHRGAPPSYFWPYQIPIITSGQSGEYLTDRITDEAEKFLAAHREKPFFLYLPHYAVHNPLMAKKDLIEKYRAKVKPDQAQNNPTYAAMIDSVDQSVGRVMKKLDELGIAQRTVVFFMSDNGGLIPNTSNAPLRAGKGSPWEGGTREPMIVRWPGVVAPGSVCGAPVTSVDFYPTILEMAGVPGEAAHNANVDGESLVPLLKQTGRQRRDAIFWHYPHYHPGGATPYGSVRQGDFKLIEFYEDNHVELYNLKDDIGEKVELSAKMPQQAQQLRKLLGDWRKQVGAQMPTPNPNYDPARDPAPTKSKKAAAKQVSWEMINEP